jgi:hypothetical protein
MRIEWTPPLRRTTARRDDKSENAPEGRFSAALAEEQPAAPTTPPPTLNSIDGLLTLQEMPDALAGRRRRSVQRGTTMLDQLDDLRLGMLTGIFSREQLDRLSRISRTTRESVDDPRLAEVLDQIDLRVAVELAKLDGRL